MFVSKLLSQDSAPLLEQMLQFTEARNTMLAEDVANIDTPGFRQKDLSVAKFQMIMRDRLSKREQGEEVDFSDIGGEKDDSTGGILFHDMNNRSAEQLMSEFAKNALMHNMAVELLRKQYSTMEMALREKVG